MRYIFCIILCLYTVVPSLTVPALALVTRSTPLEVTTQPDDVIRSVLHHMGISCATAEVIVAQARLESGHFLSDVYRMANNPFGMRVAVVRANTACGYYNGYACYASLEDAVVDYVLWMQAVCIPFSGTDADTYIRILRDRKYFQEREDVYLRRVKQLMRYPLCSDVVA